MNTKAVQKYEQSLQQTVERFGSLISKDNREEELAKLHKMIELGFDPRLGHMTVYEQKLWLCHVGAMWWKNKQDTDRRFGIVHRIIQKDERELYGLVDGDIGVISQILDYRNGGVVIAEGFGKANPLKPHRGEKVSEDRKQYLPEVKFPFIIAQKRAEVQVIKRGFSIGIEIGTMADEDSQVINGESRIVEDSTGEIKEPTKPLHTYLEKCPLHDFLWSINRFNKRSHKTDEGEWCNFADVMRTRLYQATLWLGYDMTKYDNDEKKFALATSNSKIGKPYSKCEDEEILTLVLAAEEKQKEGKAPTDGDPSEGSSPEEEQHETRD